MFFQRGLRIEFMHTDTKLAPFGGTVRPLPPLSAYFE